MLLASGKHDLRGFARPPGPQGDLVALKMYYHLSPRQTAALEGHVELLLHPHGYTGLQLVEDGSANLCALVRRRHLARVGGWLGLLAEISATNPHAAERLQDAVATLNKPLALGAIPYGFVREDALDEGLYAVGDQAAVIPSFTGDGMSIALYSGMAAAHAILSGEPAQLFQGRLARTLASQVHRATALSRLLPVPMGQPLLAGAARLWPEGLGQLAMLTRLGGGKQSLLSSILDDGSLPVGQALN